MTANIVFDMPGVVEGEECQEESSDDLDPAVQFLSERFIELEQVLVDSLGQQQHAFMEELVGLLANGGIIHESQGTAEVEADVFSDVSFSPLISPATSPRHGKRAASRQGSEASARQSSKAIQEAEERELPDLHLPICKFSPLISPATSPRHCRKASSRQGSKASARHSNRDVTSVCPQYALDSPDAEFYFPDATTPSFQVQAHACEATTPFYTKRGSRLSDTAAVQQWSHAMEGDGLHSRSQWRIVNHCRGVLRARGFEQMIALLIVFNSCSVAARADYGVRFPTQATPMYMNVFERLCTAIFTIELLVRLVAEGRHFFSCRNRHMKWNLLDAVLVVGGLGEELLETTLDVTVDASFVRLVRFLRLVRIMRLVRVMRFFQDLRNMVSGILVSIKPLVWALVLLTMIAFMFSIFILEMVGTEILTATRTNNLESVAGLQLHFGGIFETLYSLYKAITGGISWGEQAIHLVNITPWLGLAFCVYVAFSVICVMNIVTGIFVENSSKLSMRDEGTLLMELMDSESKWIEEMSSIYNVLSGGAVEVSKSQFEIGMRDFGIQAKLKKLGVDMDSYALRGIFDIIDFDKSGWLSLEEFLLGIRMLHGNAKSIDIAKLLYDNITIKAELRQITTKLKHRKGPGVKAREHRGPTVRSRSAWRSFW
eukprot:TRINITY_DN16644_c0_g5_i1.p1 TRINITY_DN16644_c0_g5~~TRINITY_DN16644_c0_g5_i1.p1  ORF type:complete len:658 (+),score=80.83 TRINITY_DN16644_c0_g5_i1:99-2072(+)